MTSFERFLQTYEPEGDCETVDAVSMSTYESRLPDELLEMWRTLGWCAFAGGLLWFTNPADYETVMMEWFTNRKPLPLVFGRTAFGDLFLWHEQHVDYLYVHLGHLATMTPRIDLFINHSLTNDDYLEEIVGRSFFEKVKRRLGAISQDEMYTFEPALALGGSGAADTVAIVKINEQLSILAQLTGGIRL